MGFFSYQPSQGLSRYKTPTLERTSAPDQDFIDPSLDPSGGLDDLSLGGNSLDPNNVGRTEGGGFFNTSTGTQFGVSDSFRSAVGAGGSSRQISGPSGLNTEPDTLGQFNLANKTTNAASKGLSELSKLVEPQNKLTTGNVSDDGLSLYGTEVGKSSDSVGANLAQTPDTYKLWQKEFNQSPDDMASYMQPQGQQPFTLTDGSNKLDANFLQNYDGSNLPAGPGQKSLMDFMDDADMALNGQTAGNGSLNIGAGAKGALGTASGVYSLLQAAQNGSIPGGVGGVLQIVGGISELLKMSPEFTSQISSMLGMAGDTLANVGGAVGGAASLGGGLLGLYSGIQSGNPGTILGGVVSTLQGLQLAAPVAFESAVNAVATALSVSAVALNAVALYIPVIGIIIQAVTAYFGSQDETNARRSGAVNNPIAGNLYSNATAGVQRANTVLDAVDTAGLQNIPTDQLMQLLPAVLSSLSPYYAVGQGGAGPIRASDTVTGRASQNGTPYGGDSPEAYTGRFTQAQDRVRALVVELVSRGVPYEQIGMLPTQGDWVNSDTADPEQDIYNLQQSKWDTEAGNIWNKITTAPQFQKGQQVMLSSSNESDGPSFATSPDTYRYPTEPGYLSEEYYAGTPTYGTENIDYTTETAPGLLTTTEGAARQAPDSVTHASGLITGRFGGPTWYALLRSNSLTPELRTLIEQHYDPWFMAREASTDSLVDWLRKLHRSGYQDGGPGGIAEGTTAAPSSPDTGEY